MESKATVHILYPFICLGFTHEVHRTSFWLCTENTLDGAHGTVADAGAWTQVSHLHGKNSNSYTLSSPCFILSPLSTACLISYLTFLTSGRTCVFSVEVMLGPTLFVFYIQKTLLQLICKSAILIWIHY